MAMRRLLLVASAILIVVALLGRTPYQRWQENRLVHIPVGTLFHPIDTVEGFAANASLTVQRDPDQPAEGTFKVNLDLFFPTDRVLKDARVVIYLPVRAELPMPMSEYLGPAYSILPESGSRDLGQPNPRYGFGTTRPFFDHEQLMIAFTSPIRLKVIWKDGVQFLQIPPAQLQIAERRSTHAQSRRMLRSA